MQQVDVGADIFGHKVNVGTLTEFLVHRWRAHVFVVGVLFSVL